MTFYSKKRNPTGCFLRRLSKKENVEEEKKQWMVVGLIGGLISVISLTMPWLTLGVSKSSGWELTEIVASPYLLLFGGIFGMVGVVLVLWRNELGGLIPIGGILSFLGWL
ncbi:MAG: hypothetical protein QW356_05885 [Candidatus Hadarchaeales archaeon]